MKRWIALALIALFSAVACQKKGRSKWKDSRQTHEITIPDSGIVVLSLEELNGGHSFGVSFPDNSFFSLEDYSKIQISSKKGSLTEVNPRRKDEKIKLINFQYLAMIYANDKADLTLRFPQKFSGLECSILILSSVEQTLL